MKIKTIRTCLKFNVGHWKVGPRCEKGSLSSLRAKEIFIVSILRRNPNSCERLFSISEDLSHLVVGKRCDAQECVPVTCELIIGFFFLGSCWCKF